MRTYKAMEATQVNNIENHIACNKCGIATQLSNNEIAREYVKEQYSEIQLSFGYGSSWDSQNWSFDLCEDCLRELVKSFKIVPKGFGEDSYYAHYPQVMFEEWKETGVVDLEAGMTAEEIEANGGSIYSEEEEDDEEN